MIDGHGDPDEPPAFTQAVEALYPVAYKLKFASKRELGGDSSCLPLEGLWWAQDMEHLHDFSRQVPVGLDVAPHGPGLDRP